MVRSTKKASLIKGRRIRVTRLDNCGRVLFGDNATVTSKGMISVGFTANTQDTDAITVVNANGETIAFEAGSTALTGYGLEIVMGEVDPGLFTLMTGNEPIRNADGVIVGLGVDTKVDISTEGLALEVWAGAPTDEACDDDSQGQYGYVLVPFLNKGILGDFSIENGAISMTLTGMNSKDGNAWGVGPYDVMLNNGATDADPKVPGPLLEAISPTLALLLMWVDVVPPEPETGLRPLLDPANAVVASITKVTHVGTRVVDFAVTPDPEAGVGVWWDFGDDTWDFVVAGGGDVTHEYAAAGTYTVSVSTNGTWITNTVTVPGVA